MARAAAPAGAAVSPSPGDRYEVFVSGVGLAEVGPKLAGTSVTAEAVAGGVVLKPGLPLREAVDLSKTLSADGLKVQVRRVSASPAGPPAPATFYRVRVGGYSDRASALAAVRELEAKGYHPFIARSTP